VFLECQGFLDWGSLACQVRLEYLEMDYLEYLEMDYLEFLEMDYLGFLEMDCLG
jgi:hypothetical protein